MTSLLVIVLGLVAGFGGSRLLRRPSSSAGAASVARTVGSAVGTRRGLDLPHLQRSTLSEMMRHVAARGGVTTVPATFRVRLHPTDHETVQQAPGFFVQGLEQALAAAAADHGWVMPARLKIELADDPSRPQGAPTVDAVAPAIAPSAAPPAGASAGPATGAPRLERDDGKPPAPLSGVETTIGRNPECGVQIDDSRVSRQHAKVTRSGAGFAVIDSGSSNGTRLNGNAIAAHVPTPLRDGDRLGIGPVELVFRAGAPDGSLVADGEPGHYQRYLDEAQRRSISQEYFPDGGTGGPR